MLCLWVLVRGLQALFLENDSPDTTALFVWLHKHSGLQIKQRRGLEKRLFRGILCQQTGSLLAANVTDF